MPQDTTAEKVKRKADEAYSAVMAAKQAVTAAAKALESAQNALAAAEAERQNSIQGLETHPWRGTFAASITENLLAAEKTVEEAQRESYSAEIGCQRALENWHRAAGTLEIVTRGDDSDRGHIKKQDDRNLCCTVNPIRAVCIHCREEGFCDMHLSPCKAK